MRACFRVRVEGGSWERKDSKFVRGPVYSNLWVARERAFKGDVV